MAFVIQNNMPRRLHHNTSPTFKRLLLVVSYHLPFVLDSGTAPPQSWQRNDPRSLSIFLCSQARSSRSCQLNIVEENEQCCHWERNHFHSVRKLLFRLPVSHSLEFIQRVIFFLNLEIWREILIKALLMRYILNITPNQHWVFNIGTFFA